MNRNVYVCLEERDYLQSVQDMIVFSDREDAVWWICRSIGIALSAGWMFEDAYQNTGGEFDLERFLKELDKYDYADAGMDRGDDHIAFCCARKEINE